MIIGRMLNSDLRNMLEADEGEASQVVDEIGSVWLVTMPQEKAELSGIMGEHTILDIVQMAMAGSLRPESILGIYKNEGKAKKAAQDALDQAEADMKDQMVSKDYTEVAISAGDWKKVLSAAKIPPEPVRSDTSWKWMGPGIAIRSTIDPFTGKSFDRAVAELTPDEAGTVSIEGTGEMVAKIADMIESMADGKASE